MSRPRIVYYPDPDQMYIYMTDDSGRDPAPSIDHPDYSRFGTRSIVDAIRYDHENGEPMGIEVDAPRHHGLNLPGDSFIYPEICLSWSLGPEAIRASQRLCQEYHNLDEAAIWAMVADILRASENGWRQNER